ncbi:hypothetical protein MMC21_003422 [Puttea exsequens]|nr:hypothetical protein [Puttea exsequens]
MRDEPTSLSSSLPDTSDKISNPTSTVEATSKSTASETTKQPEATQTTKEEVETDSPLDNSNFLSFEDWKRQNLAKAGQSADNLATRENGGVEPRRRPGGINNALDSLGEDTEIEIDFGGFGNPEAPAPTVSATHKKEVPRAPKGDDSSEGGSAQDGSGVRRRSKDAGKTYKERSNYASFDCAASVMKTNPECTGWNAILVENKDSYMLNKCSAGNKFLIVELCDDILIDTVVLANFEFFSSMFRTFRVSVSDRYPVKIDKWKVLGEYEARNSREVQAFLVENPLIWARYLRVEFLTHFGNEYYCPVSLLRVHGTTMMEEFNHDLKRSGTEETEIDEGEDEEAGSIEAAHRVVSAEALKTEISHVADSAQLTASAPPSTTTVEDTVELPEATSQALTVEVKRMPVVEGPQASNGYNASIARMMEILLSESIRLEDTCLPGEKPVGEGSLPSTSSAKNQPTTPERTHSTILMAEPALYKTLNETGRAVSKIPSNSADPAAVIVATASLTNTTQNRSEPTRTLNQTSTASVKAQASSAQPLNPNPTTQESFFKSVHKRLQLLESNSTLSLQYIEEQSRILRDAFAKVEKRQLAKTNTFLETLNTTVLTELRDFRLQYDQIWQSTVLELSSQREQSQHEVLALSARLSILADEIVFQKRMAILQFALILLCLGLVLFSRHGSPATYLELPLVLQTAISKSSANLSRYAPLFDTPPASPTSSRPGSRYGLLRSLTQRYGASDESQADRSPDGTKSPNIEYSPPTPTSSGAPGSPQIPPEHARGRGGDSDNSSMDSGLEADAHAVRQTKSSPATPNGAMEARKEFVEGPSFRSDGEGEGLTAHR